MSNLYIKALSVPVVARNGRIYTNNIGSSTVSHSSSSSINSINLPFFNVKDFGVLGDGITDDSANLQTAINTANNEGGGILYFPSGEYKLSTGLIGYSNITFQGVGREATKLSTMNFGAGETFGTGSTSTKMLYFVDANNVTIKDMWLQGVSIDGSSSQGIWFDLLNEGNCENIVIDNVLVTDHASNSAIFIDTPILSTLNNVKVLRVAGHCIKMTGGTSTTINETYAITCTEAGFMFDTMTYCTFNSCASEVAGVCYDFLNCSSIVLNGCGCEGAVNRNDGNDKYKYGENGYGTFKTPYDGVSYRSVNSKIQLNSCYSRDPDTYHTVGYFDKINCREFSLIPHGCNVDYSGTTRQYTQGSNTTLASAINNSQTTITLATGTGNYFSSSDFWVIIYPSTYNSAFEAYASTDQTYGGNAELFHVLSRLGDVLTVEARGQGTFWNRFEARAFNAGDKVDHANLFFYAITFVDNLGRETRMSDYPWRGYRSLAQMILKDIPISTNSNVVARNIYRTNGVSSQHGSFYKIHTINDNITTSWADNVIDNFSLVGSAPEPTSHLFTTTANSTSIWVNQNRFIVGDIIQAEYSDYLPYPFSISSANKYKVLTVNGNLITVCHRDDTTNTPMTVSFTTQMTDDLYLYKYDMAGEDCGIENNFITYFNTLTGDTAYTLPVATASVLGGVKQGTNITIDANGVISAAGGTGSTYNQNTDLTARKVTSYYNLKVQNSGITQVILNNNGASFGNIQNDAVNTWSLGYTSTDTTALGTSVLSWKNNNRVGINNNNPGYTLDINGDLNFTGNIYKNGSLFSDGSSGTTYLTTATGAAKSGSTTNSFNTFDLNVHEDEYLTGQLFQTFHNGKAGYRGNWTHSNYWGIGATDSNNIVKMGNANEDGTFNNGAFILELAGASNGIIISSPDGTRYKLTVANGGTLSISPA